MRWVVVAGVAAAACSPNDTAPARPDAAHHGDAPAATPDSRIDAPHTVPDGPLGIPDAWQPLPDASITPSDVQPHIDLFPSAPTTTAFAWQSLQERFHRSDASTCTGQVTVAVSDRAVCFVGTDDEVHCAGAIYTHDYGTSFTSIGVTGVDQIWLGPTVNSATGNAICVHKRAGTVWCMGDGNSLGQFGNGSMQPSAGFTQFGSATNLVRMGGDWNTRCALDTAGRITCAGNLTQSATPVLEPGTGHTGFYLTSFGMLVVDDPGVFRQSKDSPCEIHGDGLHCAVPNVPAVSGTAGEVVDGGVVMPIGGLAMGDQYPCWLDPAGVARCTRTGTTAAVFAAAPPIIALATDFYADSRCAVANDGSLWCYGANANGELGVGNTLPLPQDTMVVAPGSVKIDCH